MHRRRSEIRQKFSWPHLINALATALLVYVLSHTALVRNAEFQTLDTRFKLRGPITTQGQTVIIGIDQQSYEDMGQTFPWPRRYHAKLLENLTLAGARIVIYDLIFDVPGAEAADDAAFAEAMTQHGRVILGAKQEALRETVQGSRMTYPIPILREAAAAIGLVDRLEDSDGFTRRYRLSVPTPDGPLFSLGLEAIRLDPDLAPGTAYCAVDENLEIGPCGIPRVDATSFLINYRGATGTIPTYSFSSVIDDASFDLPAGLDVDAFEYQKEVFRDKIVLIGATLPELQDFVRSPFFETRSGERILTPGVEMHANAIETILSGKYYRYPGAWVEAGLLLLVALLVSFATLWLRPIAGHAVVILIAVGIALAALGLFLQARLILPVVAPLGVVLVGHGANTLYFFVRERRERRRIKGMFAKYVPEKVVNALIANPNLMTLGGEERELTVLFSDLAGFTRFSEGLTPPQLVSLLNEYLSEMTDIVLAHDGIIDKYEGDLIMAEFGAPLHDPDHALKACRAALAMQRRLAELREVWHAEGREPLFARIGLNTGPVILGNMGSRAVHDYTVLGDAVNLASRLEGANKVYHTAIMISESTYALIRDDLAVRELDRIRVLGRAQAETVYELLDTDEIDLTDYAAGLAAYRARRWQEAEAHFRAALEHDPDDGPTQVFLERARHYLETPPPDDWDGVFDMPGK